MQLWDYQFFLNKIRAAGSLEELAVLEKEIAEEIYNSILRKNLQSSN